jgi:hypothetical protein
LRRCKAQEKTGKTGNLAIKKKSQKKKSVVSIGLNGTNCTYEKASINIEAKRGTNLHGNCPGAVTIDIKFI